MGAAGTKLVDHAACLLNQIWWQNQCWRQDENGFVHLKTAYLRRTVGREQLPKVRRLLSDGNVLDWHRGYQAGVRSMGYRICPSFRITTRFECRDSRLIGRIRRVAAETERKLLPVHEWLRNQLCKFEIDIDHARSIISGMVPDSGNWPFSDDEYRGLLLNQSQSLFEQLRTGEPDLICDRFGRAHSQFTRLPSELRCCVSVQGSPLFGIDLKNSQPWFAGIVAAEFLTDRNRRNRLSKWKPAGNPYKGTGGRREAAGQPASIMMAEMPQPVDQAGSYKNDFANISDLWEYMDFSGRGILYESLMQRGEDRQRFKKRVFTHVYYGPDDFPSTLRQEFRQKFPSVGQMLRILKQGNYARPAWLMQNREARVFIGRIARRLMLEHPTTPVITIHDSLLTTEEHLEIVERIAREELSRFGFPFALKRESFTP